MCVPPHEPIDKYTRENLGKRNLENIVGSRELNSGVLYIRGGIPAIVRAVRDWFFFMLAVRMVTRNVTRLHEQ